MLLSISSTSTNMSRFHQSSLQKTSLSR